MEYEDSLREIGLPGNEAKVYLCLLQRGSCSANMISKYLSMDRTLTYTVVNHLIEKGLVSYIIKDKRKYFEASDPDNLLNPIKKKEAFIKDLVPELKSIQKVQENYHDVKIYEGKEGVRTLTRLMMKHKEVLCFGGTGKMYDLLYESPRLVKEWKGKANIIVSDKHKSHHMKAIPIVETRFLPVDAETTTSIFGNYITMHNLINKPLVIIIKNKEFSQSYRNYFNFMWQKAKR